MLYRYFSLLLLLTLLGCVNAPPSPQERRDKADQLAATANWQKQKLVTNTHTLVAYGPKLAQEQPNTTLLTIYIEGDGLAWISKSMISLDPTPINPLALKLALKHPSGTAAYLARPCQYVEKVDAGNCHQSHWTQGRFSSELVEASRQAVNQLMQQYGATQLQLIGYSGGGAIAALVAAQRNDVVSLISVAGNLDHKAWTKHHRVSPLKSSLNPADNWQTLKDIPQHHFVGGQDRVISKKIINSYASRFPENKKPQVKLIPDFNHACCWAEQWPQLIKSIKTKL